MLKTRNRGNREADSETGRHGEKSYNFWIDLPSSKLGQSETEGGEYYIRCK